MRRPALPMFGLALAFIASCSAAPFVDRHDSDAWSDGAGTSARWSPAKPSIGDIVRLEASFSEIAQRDLSLPGGAVAVPLEKSFRSGVLVERWTIRVKAAGNYSLGAQNLWTVSSVCQGSSELKTHDASELWTGRSPKGASK